MEYEPQPDPESDIIVDESAPQEPTVVDGEAPVEPEIAETPLEQTYTLDQVRAVQQETINRNNAAWEAQNAAQAAPPVAAAVPAEPVSDPAMELVISKLSNDESGKETLSLLEAFWEAKKGGGNLSEDRVREIAGEISNVSTDGIRSSLGIETAVGAYVTNGVLDQASAESLKNQYQMVASQPDMRAAAAHPTNSTYLLKSVFADMVSSGQIKTHQARPASPLQSGGGGRGTAPAESGPNIEDVQKKFPSLRGLKIDQLKAAGRTSISHYSEAHGQR